MSLLSGKYKLRILHVLIKDSPRRLEPEIAGISPSMLTSQFSELETDEMVSREIFATVPPTVKYRLTEFGQTTQQMMNGP